MKPTVRQSAATRPSSDPNDVVWPSEITPITEDGILNILLIGQDRRPDQPRQRSDSMIILSYNMKSKKATLISLMRDMYVQIPGYSDNRINAAYQFGGMELLDSTIDKNFGVRIDGNMEVDFDGFSSIVDLLGGVDIDIADYDVAYLNTKYHWNLISGLNHLDGEKTLAYSQIRYVGNADYERTERQRNVMTLLIDKIMDLNTAEQLKMLDAVLPYLTTDMSKQDIVKYCMSVMSNGLKGIKKYRIPADETFSSPVIRGMDVLLPDLAKNQELLMEYILG